jgi:hypothetical protein
MHVNSEFVSNKIDENDLQSKKQNEHDEEWKYSIRSQNIESIPCSMNPEWNLFG